MLASSRCGLRCSKARDARPPRRRLSGALAAAPQGSILAARHRRATASTHWAERPRAPEALDFPSGRVARWAAAPPPRRRLQHAGPGQWKATRPPLGAAAAHHSAKRCAPSPPAAHPLAQCAMTARSSRSPGWRSAARQHACSARAAGFRPSACSQCACDWCACSLSVRAASAASVCVQPARVQQCVYSSNAYAASVCAASVRPGHRRGVRTVHG